MNKNLLTVDHLSVGFERHKEFRQVLHEVSFEVQTGEIIGIVGESGSGKSLTSLTIMDLLSRHAKIVGGRIEFDGIDLLSLKEEQKRKLKGSQMAMIFQEPMTSLNPAKRIGSQVEEVLKVHTNDTKEVRKQKVLSMLKEVGLSDVSELCEKYPHQLSGGMRQRVMIAMAMIGEPKLLIADEPTTALDVTVQAQILDLIQKMSKKHKTAVILISHDLGVIKSICDRTFIMYEGRIIEEGLVEDIFQHPKQEYTKKLLQAVPSLKRSIITKSGEDPVDDEIILQVNNLSSYYENSTGFFGKSSRRKVLDHVSLEVRKSEIYGIVGESGSGKSTLAKAIVGMLRDVEGTITCHATLPQMVFQDPYSSLNPSKKVGWILEEPLKIQGGWSKEQRKEKVRCMLEEVGLPIDYEQRYVAQLSGGQRQRVAIGVALMNNAKFILLDEPVSALDVTIQAQILELLKRLQREYGLSYLFISHDLNVVYQLCDRISVMYQGKIVETKNRDDLYLRPEHEYTKKLIASMPNGDF